jgi:hypothetical protein
VATQYLLFEWKVLGGYPILYSINNERKNATNIIFMEHLRMFLKNIVQEKSLSNLRVPPIFFIEQVRKKQQKKEFAKE